MRIYNKLPTSFGETSLIHKNFTFVTTTMIVYQQTGAFPLTEIIHCNKYQGGVRFVYFAGLTCCQLNKYMRINEPSHIWDAMH